MRGLRIILSAAAMFLTLSMQANHTWYVSRSAGSNDNDGSREKPFANIQKAIDVAAAGDVVQVAEGNYFGLSDNGSIKIDKGITIKGGWSADFSERNVLIHRTYIQPTAASNATALGKGTVIIAVNQAGTCVELDGLIMDRGNTIAYCKPGEGQPEGVETAMMRPIATAGVGAPGVPETKVYTAETAIIAIQPGTKCDVIVRNCAFINGPCNGISGSTSASTVIIDNCIFVNIRMAAVELRGTSAETDSRTIFTNNTILFAWSRLKDLTDMGYGFRFLPRMASHLDHNVIGCCTFAGLDSPATKEQKPEIDCRHSLFFQNRQADLTLPGSGMFRRIAAADFGADNQTVTDPAIFGGAINAAYLEAFLQLPVAIPSNPPMFANHYPVEDALRLFGAVSGYGAQQPK